MGANRTGDDRFLSIVPKSRQFGAMQAKALRKSAWNGEWFNRAWVPVNESAPLASDFPGGWQCTNGADKRLCLEPQSWAIIAQELHRDALLSDADVGRLIA